jgi:hypothetical protein
VKGRLDSLESFLNKWAIACCCEKKEPSPPYKPTWKINEKLDLVSMWIEIDIRLMAPRTWKYYLSTYAQKYAVKERRR